MKSPDWSGSSGDIWARRWRDTDRALAEVGEALDSAILKAAPAGPFRALDVGCGPGTTALALARSRTDAEIIGCDLSPQLIALAEQRAKEVKTIRFMVKDAERAARDHGPFDLIFSRHGVMFFDEPYRAFASLRSGAKPGANLVFSCFRAWTANPWAAEVSSAAAGREVPPPGREPSGFAFADPDYVADILAAAGWAEAEPTEVDFDYIVGSREEALDVFSELGPAARLMDEMDAPARAAAMEAIRGVVERHERGGVVQFPAAAWIWTSRAG